MIKKNNKEIVGVFKGTTEISAVYKGLVLVYQNAKTMIAEGVPPLIVLNALDKALLGYKVYGNTTQQILPDGYTQLEYIEATGTQYIDTGFSPDGNTQVDYKVETTTGPFDASPFIGARLGTSGANRFFPISYMNVENQCRSTFGTVTILIDITGDTLFEGSFQPKNNVSIINGTSYDISNAGFQKEDSNNLYIFATSGYTGNLYQSHGKMYYCKIYDNGTLIRNYIPAKNSLNVVGLYDTVNNVFYTNAGTGTFTAGLNAPTPNAPIEIESVGNKTNNLFNAQQIATDSNIPIIDEKYLRCRDFYEGFAVINGTFKENTQYTLKIKAVCQNNEASAVQFWAYYKDGTSSRLFLGQVDSDHQEIELIGRTEAGKTVDYINSYSNFYATYYLVEIEGSQLVEGTYTSETMPAYEPYGYNIPVTISSRNLLKIYGRTRGYPSDTATSNTTKRTFDFNTYVVGIQGNNWYVPSNIGDNFSINSDNSVTVKSSIASYGIGFPIRVKPNTVYFTPVADVNSTYDNILISLYNSDGTWSRVTSYGNTTKIRTSSDETIAVVIVKPTTANVEKTISDIFMEKSDIDDVTASPRSSYSVYSGPTTTTYIYLDEPLRKLGNYTDYIDFETQKVYRNVKQLVYNGTNLKVTYQSTRYTDYTRLVLTPFSPANAQTGALEELCNYFVQKSSYSANMFIVGYNNAASLFLADSLIGTTSEDTSSERIAKANAWLQSLNPYLEIAYPLATPTEESITLPEITLNKGTNVVEIDTSITPSDVWIKYKGKA